MGNTKKDVKTAIKEPKGVELVTPEKKKIGKPLKFQDVADLQDRIEVYFAEVPKDEWTITGLALALNTSRQLLMDYEGRPEYLDTIKKAKLMIENSYELDLKKHGRSGTIFALKNFNWRDATEVTTTENKKTLIQNNFYGSELLKAAADALIEDMNEQVR